MEFKVGDIVLYQGERCRIVWLYNNGFQAEIERLGKYRFNNIECVGLHELTHAENIAV